MKSFVSASLAILFLLGTAWAREADGNAKASIERFNQAARSWRKLQKDLDTLPAGHLKQAGHLAAYAERMHGVLREIHDATVDLPISETTKICLDYALHQGCDMCECATECCRKARTENRPPSPEEVDALVVKVAKQACECTLPIRLAIRHDLLQAGVSDRKTLDSMLMIPENAEYKGMANVVWTKPRAAGSGEPAGD